MSMTGAFTLLSMGLVLGLQHATDSDHVVAVTTVVARERRVGAAARIGLLWGLGHSATVLVVGGGMVATGVVISPRAALSLELCVAVMLVILGGMGVRRALDARHRPHGSAEQPHRHDTVATDGRRSWLRPIAVGIVHGLAGSAAIALAVLATIRDRITSLGYLATFSVGTILGMSLITALISTPIAVATKRVDPRWLLRVGALAGLVSVGLGIWMGYEIGMVNGLFLANAQAAPP